MMILHYFHVFSLNESKLHRHTAFVIGFLTQSLACTDELDEIPCLCRMPFSLSDCELPRVTSLEGHSSEYGLTLLYSI